jgi:uncharacterized protein (TIGR03067 family)
MSAKWLLASSVLLLLAASVQADDKASGDTGKMIGNWTYVSGERDGNKVDPENLKKGIVAVTKDTITLKGGEQGEFILKYKLDTKKNPWAISMEITEGPAGQGAKAEGIITVSGDEMKIAYNPMGGKAPTAFAAKKDSGDHYFVLRRKK